MMMIKIKRVSKKVGVVMQINLPNMKEFRLFNFLTIFAQFSKYQINICAVGDPDYEVLEYVIFTIDIVEYIVVSFFLVEYVIRLITCPRKIKFFFQLMNLIDFFALIPFFLSLLLEGLEDFEIVGKTGKIIRLIRVMRILRSSLLSF